MADNGFTNGPSVAAQHDIVHDGAFRVAPTNDKKNFNAIRIPIVPVACWRLNAPAFAFDSSFVSPAFAPEVARLPPLLAANDGCLAAIFGHADPVGSDDINKTISDRRAIAVYALLTRQPPLWEDLYANPADGDAWGASQIQAMLATVVGRQTDDDGNVLPPNSPYYSDPIDGNYGPATRGAVKAFQTDAGLAVDGQAGPNTRRVLFGAYMDALCTPPSDASDYAPPPPAKPMMQPANFLGGGALGALPKMALQGCGAFNPIVLLANDEESDAGGARDADNAANRRVLLFLFKPREIGAGDWPCPAVKASGSACTAQFWPDGDGRRKNTDALRFYKDSRDTMACRFYDRFARRSPCEGGYSPSFRFAIPVGDDAWPESATVSLLQDDKTIWSASVSGGRLTGQYRAFSVQVGPGIAVRGVITVGAAELGLFGDSPAYDIASASTDDTYLMPRIATVLRGKEEG